MIKSLALNNFGKFSGYPPLDFGSFTVITGPNEAGKTTIFDALLHNLCPDSRKKDRRAGKSLEERYGAQRDSSLIWEKGSAPLSFDSTEFLEIFAVRGGDISVTAAKGKSWETIAESRLLTSGLDPKQIAAGLRYQAETKSKDSAQAEILGLQKVIGAAKTALAEMKSRRDSIIGGGAEQAELEAAIKNKKETLAAKAAELQALQGEIDKLASAGKLKAALAGIKALREFKEAGDELAALAAFARNETPAYLALKGRQLEAEKAAVSAEAALSEKRSALSASNSALSLLASRERSLKPRKELAESISAKVTAFASEPLSSTRVSRPVRWAIWAAGAALACFVAYSGGNPGAYAAAAAIFIASVWVGLTLSARPVSTLRAPAEVKKFLAGLASDWAGVSPEPFPALDLEAARVYLAGAAAGYASALEMLSAKAAENAVLEAGVKMAEQNLEVLKEGQASAKSDAEAWLKARGCSSEEDYRGKISAYENASARASALALSVSGFRQKNGSTGDEDLKNTLFIEKEALDRRGVDPDLADEPELERLNKRAATLVAEKDALTAAVNAADRELESRRAASGARLEGLPERINRAETEIAAATDDIISLELRIQAYILAAGIFDKLADSSALAFTELGKEVSATLSAVLPSARTEFRVFDAHEASLSDAGGNIRQIKQLSSGTRDLFMLAARLTMAKKARTDKTGKLSPALLVLDEPFYTLDPARTGAALKLLASFQEATGWQIIILTKDPAIRALAGGIKPAITGIDL